MDPLMLVEVLDEHGRAQIRQRYAGAGQACRIGRSLASDITLDDDFAAPEHARLTLLHDGRVLVQDLGTRNGTRVGRLPVDAQDGRIISGGELLIGRTRVRVRTGEQPLAPERVFRRDALRRHRTLLAVLGMALCAAFAAFQQWIFAPDQLVQRILLAELALMAALALWVGAWCLISRLSVGAWQVRIHLSIAAVCLGLWVWGYWLQALGAFALQWRLLPPVAGVLAGAVALAAAYLHLRNGTSLPRTIALSLALLVPPVLGGVWWLVDQQLDPRSVSRMELGPEVFPPNVRLAPSFDVADYLADVAALKREANRNRQSSLLETPIIDPDDQDRQPAIQPE